MPAQTPTACHEGDIALDEPCNEGAPAGIGTLTARFVHYPGCQQLQVWLPQSGWSGYGRWRRIDGRGQVAEEAAVSDTLNGSVQMLFDTLAWPPGRWRIEMDHADGWRHVLAMCKQADGAGPAAEEAPPAAAVREATAAGVAAASATAKDGTSATPAPKASARRRTGAPRAGDLGAKTPAAASSIRYRDGRGQDLPDEFQHFRERALAVLADRFSRKVSYEGYHRAGTYTYRDGALCIRFSQEMGGGGCKSVIAVPGAAQWEAATGVPLAQRDEILRCVAEQARSDQGSRYEIGDESIAVY